MRIIATIILSLAATTAVAETVKLSAMEQFQEQKSIILKDLDSNTIYREILYTDMKIVKDALDRMTDTLSATDQIEDLPEDRKVRLFNDQELVNTILTMAENDSRMVCRRRGRLGTNFKETYCESVKDRRARQEEDRRKIDQLIIGTPIVTN